MPPTTAPAPDDAPEPNDPTAGGASSSDGAAPQPAPEPADEDAANDGDPDDAGTGPQDDRDQQSHQTDDEAFLGGKVGKPVGPLNRPTRAQRARKAAASTSACERARVRYLIARTAVTFAPAGPASAQQAAVERAVEAGLLTLGEDHTVPSLDTIRTLVRRWRAGDQSIGAFLDRPRAGRRPGALDTRLADVIRTAAFTGHPGSVAAVHRQVCTVAKALGLTPPPYSAVLTRYASVGRAVRSAAKHGARAAEIDGLPHSTIPVQGPHDVWTIDECTLPVWARVYDAVKARWRSIRPDAVVIQDYFSRAVIAYWIVDPADRRGRGRTHTQTNSDAGHASAEETTDASTPASRRRAQKRTTTRWAAANGNDLKGALFSAACPELAPPATVAFAGSLPRRIRWDNARTHKALVEQLEALGVEVSALPFERPVNRGIVERNIGTLKSWCDVLFSHRDRVLPADRLPKPTSGSPALAKQAAKQTRRSLVRVVPTDLLPTIPALRAAFDAEVVRHYNHGHAHRGIGGESPYTRYVQGMADTALAGESHGRTRPGRDILGLAPVKVTTVEPGGIIHREGRCEHRFAYEIDGALLKLDTPVEYRPDPLLRALFATRKGGIAVLRPLAQWAADQNAGTVAENQAATADAYAAQTDDARLTIDILELAKIALRNAAEQAGKRRAQNSPETAEPPAPAETPASPEPAMDGDFDDDLDDGLVA